MPDINITRALLDELRQRYSKKYAHPCSLCGEPMESICDNNGVPMYACKGIKIINGKRVEKPGRKGARDSHFMMSREWIVDRHDDDVLALVDCFERMHSEVLALARNITAGLNVAAEAEAHRLEIERIKRLAGTWPDFMRVDSKGGENE